jgi:exopolyphosphatase/guanosine-5'-triphosphate,3'-diphosphate pyrophosphatase
MAGSANPHLTLSSPGAPAQGSDADIRISAIDIGSNSIRQTIADVSPTGTIRVVDEMKAAPRLGAGLYETGKLSEVAIQNALSTLTRMATLANQLGVKRTEVVATSAVRDAANGEEFLKLVKSETGLKVRVLRGEDEARLSFRSALAHFDLGVGRAVVMDIGGGSLELALSADGLVERLISLPLGAISVTERYLGPAAKKKGMRKLRKHVWIELRRHLSARHWHATRIFCSGGTFTSLASIYLARIGMESAKTVHGTVIPRIELEHIVDMLRNMSLSERQGVPGLNAARSDIILGGLAVAREFCSRARTSRHRPRIRGRLGSDQSASWLNELITRSRTPGTFRSCRFSSSMPSVNDWAAYLTTESCCRTRPFSTTSDITSATTSTTSIPTT